MKALVHDVYGEADVLSLQEIEQPAVGEKDVLVRVRAAGVDQGVWHLMSGQPLVVRAAVGLRKPRSRLSGMDLAGEVEQVGRAVTTVKPGDRVFGVGTGTFAEYALSRPERLERMPANVSYEQAAAVPVSGVTALQALRGRLGVHDDVLILGAAGGVGSFAVQVARAFGATVTGVCSAGKVEFVRGLGAERVIDYQSEAVTGAYDLILDTAGNRPLSTLRALLKPRGTLLLIGGEGGGPWLGGLDRSLRAMLLSPFTRHKLVPVLAVNKQADLRELREMIESGQIVPAVDRTFALAEGADAIRYMRSGRVRGKTVITI